MFAALPTDTKVMFAVDINKLRHSPLAQRGWDLLRDVPKVREFLDSTCNAMNNTQYAIVAVTEKESSPVWGWLKGVDRNAKFNCAKAEEHAKERQTTTTSHGDYSLVTSTTAVMEMLWVDPTTLFMLHQPTGAQPIGEDRMRKVVDSGGGIEGTELAAMLEHVDFDSGLSAVVDGALAKQPGLAGAAMSFEVDSGLRAQVYVLFDSEDRAHELQSQYRTLIDQFLRAHMIDGGEARANGRGMAASISLTGAQVNWWVELALAKSKDPNAPAPPLPTGGPS